MNNKLVELTNRLLRAEMVYERVRIMQRTIIGLKQEQEGIRVVF